MPAVAAAVVEAAGVEVALMPEEAAVEAAPILEDAVEAVHKGAAFIVQGEPLLSQSDAAQKLKEFIDTVKRAA